MTAKIPGIAGICATSYISTLGFITGVEYAETWKDRAMDLLATIVILAELNWYDPYMFIRAPDKNTYIVRAYEDKVLRRLQQVCRNLLPRDNNYVKLVLYISRSGKVDRVELIDTDYQSQTTHPAARGIVNAVNATKFGKPPDSFSGKADFYIGELETSQ
jgi:hypothetical protein